jgi:hypothetical protein
MCVFSLSSPSSLIILNAGVPDKMLVTLSPKPSTLGVNATPRHSLHSASEKTKQQCSRKHWKASEGSGLMSNREDSMFNNSETWRYQKIGH